MFDTHAHLDARAFNRDRDEVIARAFDAGVEGIVNVGTDLASSRRCIALAEQYDQLFAAVGFHPHDAHAMSAGGWKELEALAAHHKVVAIGETGLDFYRELSPRSVQVAAFRAHIRLAERCGLPLIVHDREAHQQVMAVLREEKTADQGGVLHCFPGDLNMAQEAMAIHFCLGFGGTVTFSNSKALSVAQNVSLEHIVLETDCPYLAPAPSKGKRNEPALLTHVLDRLAEGLAHTREDIERTTTQNAYRLFKLE